MEQLEKNIYRICTPFDGVYTSVFVLTGDTGTILLDCASYPEDITDCILPALEEANLTPDLILCSHFHCDHIGGLDTLLTHYPSIAVGTFDTSKFFQNHPTIHCKDGEFFYERFQVLNLKGHTDECLSVLDVKTGTLVTCDCLQQYGVGHYPTTVTDRDAYLETLKRVEKLEIKRIIGAHDFAPMGYDIVGEEKVKECLAVCRKCIEERFL